MHLSNELNTKSGESVQLNDLNCESDSWTCFERPYVLSSFSERLLNDDQAVEVLLQGHISVHMFLLMANAILSSAFLRLR